jgi:hypothetical protein
VELDSMEADELTTSILDDVFFIIKKCVKRAIGKAHSYSWFSPAGFKKVEIIELRS